ALKNAKDGWLLHPVLLDACLQVIAAALPMNAVASSASGMFIPIGVKKVRQFATVPRRVLSYVKFVDGFDASPLTADVHIFAEEGQLVAEVLGVRFAGTAMATATSALPRNDESVVLPDPTAANGTH